MKTRREVLQGMIVSIGGAALLSSCGGAATIIPTSSANQAMRFYSVDELALVSRLSDLIIPRTETPGALDVNVPGFLDALMADWADANTQQSHHQIVREIGVYLSRNFVDLPDGIAIPLLEQLDSAAYSGSGDHRGYRSLKGLITQAYFASEAGALDERKWVATPGRWDPCVDIG